MRKKYITPKETNADTIRDTRKTLSMTQAEFADFLGVSKPTVERWEKKEGPVRGEITLLCQILRRRPEIADEFSVPENIYSTRLWYMYRDMPCTLIDVNPLLKKVRIKNYSENNMFRAFGPIERPTYEDFENFLESRCFPRTGDKMKIRLKELDLPFYDPFLIVQKTEGRMAEDDFWIRLESSI